MINIHEVQRSKYASDLIWNLEKRFLTLTHHHPEPTMRAYYGFRYDEVERAIKSKDRSAVSLNTFLIAALVMGEREIQPSHDREMITAMNMGDIFAGVFDGRDILKRLLTKQSVALIVDAAETFSRMLPSAPTDNAYSNYLEYDKLNVASVLSQIQEGTNPIREIPYKFKEYRARQK